MTRTSMGGGGGFGARLLVGVLVLAFLVWVVKDPTGAATTTRLVLGAVASFVMAL